MPSEPTPLTPAEIAELRRMEAAAQRAPWIIDTNFKGANWLVASFGTASDGLDYTVTTNGVRVSECHGADAKDDATLACAARNALPALLDAAEKYPAVQSMLRDAREELARVRTAHGVSIAALETATAEAAKLRELASASPVWTDSMSNSVRADRDRLAAEVERLRGLCNKQQDRLEESLAENRKLREAVEAAKLDGIREERGRWREWVEKMKRQWGDMFRREAWWSTAEEIERVRSPQPESVIAALREAAAIRERAGQETEATT